LAEQPRSSIKTNRNPVRKTRGCSDIDNGGVLPGHPGTIVRDGYAGYTHLTDALHAWCGAHYPDLRIIPTSA
jgi:transposase